MTFAELGFVHQNDRFPGRGEIVARWIDDHMRASGVQLNELAFRLRVDARDLRRLLADRSCGHRLEDCIAAYFGWDFVEAVMTPVVGADPVTAREKELAARQAQAAAIHARLERDRVSRRNLAGDAFGANVVRMAPVGRGDRTETAQTPEGQR